MHIYKTVKKIIIFKAVFYTYKNRATLIDVITYVILEKNDMWIIITKYTGLKINLGKSHKAF